MHVDGKTAEGCASALRSLRAGTTTFAGSDVGIGAISSAPAAVVEWLTGGAEIAVAFRLIGKPPRAVERAVLFVGNVPRAHIGGDVPVPQPLQKIAIAVGGIRGPPTRVPALSPRGNRRHFLC